MFTGIVENLASIQKISSKGTNKTYTLKSSIANELKIDQSLAHNGVCLTVESINGDNYTVTAVQETLKRSALANTKEGDLINLERCLPINGRLDGHIVQGHVDQKGRVTSIIDHDGSWSLHISYNANKGHITVEKGSICINGVSLTVVESNEASFSVTIIPYTWENTNFHQLKVSDEVNLEFDILGKYIQKLQTRQ